MGRTAAGRGHVAADVGNKTRTERLTGTDHVTDGCSVMTMGDSPNHTVRTAAASMGLFLCVFSAVGLSGPGRIDVIDGTARFEVAKSIALHGDAIVRNPDVWFSVFPGRGQQPHSYYRFPHSVLGAMAVTAADLVRPPTDAFRHFCFVLVSAAAAALLSCLYLHWFLARGLPIGTAVLWALAGVFCTSQLVPRNEHVRRHSRLHGRRRSARLCGAPGKARRISASLHRRPAFWVGVQRKAAARCVRVGCSRRLRSAFGRVASSGVATSRDHSRRGRGSCRIRRVRAL